MRIVRCHSICSPVFPFCRVEINGYCIVTMNHGVQTSLHISRTVFLNRIRCGTQLMIYEGVNQRIFVIVIQLDSDNFVLCQSGDDIQVPSHVHLLKHHIGILAFSKWRNIIETDTTIHHRYILTPRKNGFVGRFIPLEQGAIAFCKYQIRCPSRLLKRIA